MGGNARLEVWGISSKLFHSLNRANSRLLAVLGVKAVLRRIRNGLHDPCKLVPKQLEMCGHSDWPESFPSSCFVRRHISFVNRLDASFIDIVTLLSTCCF